MVCPGYCIKPAFVCQFGESQFIMAKLSFEELTKLTREDKK